MLCFVYNSEQTCPTVKGSKTCCCCFTSILSYAATENQKYAVSEPLYPSAVAQVPRRNLTLKNRAGREIIFPWSRHVWRTCQKWFWPNSSWYIVYNLGKICVFQYGKVYKSSTNTMLPIVVFVPRAIRSRPHLACSPDMYGPGKTDISSGTIFWG